MSDTVIKVENLSKSYLIRHQSNERYTALRDVLTNGVKEFGNRLLSRDASRITQHATQEEFWALDDVSFEVKQGERVGIIGRNGAGKSTLLKILSRITEPTKGRIHIKGRVASLLEVGTGFHPELTGRENIYLNGAILGMTREEIRRKFDEIVAFAEVEKFLDTPVKRYSSGMYVRLAFAVAAHLEPEILVVDEVLAVGDAAFQKKCLGKMGDVGKEGRTVLFVSHNMGAIQQLCSKCVLLEYGYLKGHGMTKDIVTQYTQKAFKEERKNIVRKGNGKVTFEDYHTADENKNHQEVFLMGDDIWVHFTLSFYQTVKDPVIAIEIRNTLSDSIAHIINIDDNFQINNLEAGSLAKIEVNLLQVYLTPSEYSISLWVGENMGVACDYLSDCMKIEILQGDRLSRLTPYPLHMKVFLKSNWYQRV